MPRLNAISLYSLKSGRAARVTDPRFRIAVTSLGFEGDREFMIVDAKSKEPITQRQRSELCRLVLIAFPKSILLSFDGERCNFLVNTDCSAAPFMSKLHGENIKVLEVDSRLSAWLSERLGVPVQLVRKIPTKFRRPAGLQDSAPFLLLSQATINDVIARTGSEVPRSSLRPNLVVEGVEPYGEDAWKLIRIGSQRFTVEPCPRCVVPTINQQTGVKNPAINRELAQYRLLDYPTPEGPKKKVLLGVYLRPQEPHGTLGLNDEVIVLE